MVKRKEKEDMKTIFEKYLSISSKNFLNSSIALNQVQTKADLEITLVRAGFFDLLTDDGIKRVFRVDIKVKNKGNEPIDPNLVNIRPKQTWLIDKDRGKQFGAIYPHVPSFLLFELDHFPGAYLDTVIFPNVTLEGFVIFDYHEIEAKPKHLMFSTFYSRKEVRFDFSFTMPPLYAPRLHQQDPRVRRLLEFRKKIRPQELFPVLVEEAAVVIEENPFAFALAAVLDRGTRSEIIWTIPYHMQKQLGDLKPQFFADKSIEDLERIFQLLPVKPRYISDAPRTVKELSEMVVDEYNGKVQKIWENKGSSSVKAAFERIYGVGPGISSMIVLLLEKCFGVHFDDIDHRNMDVKPDTHVIRVFQRLGFITEPNEAVAKKAARRLNPEYPGALDAPAWIIGKKWCAPFAPQCHSCPLNEVCPKNIA